MILEGLVTSLDEGGTLHVAPMGPIVDESMQSLLLRPFRTSQTFRNLDARRQGARSFELRAATSLARLLEHQGRREEAYAALAPVYGWFTEGFDTADLRAAKALLGSLP